MKRPAWSAYEALRRSETGLASESPAEDLPLDTVIVPLDGPVESPAGGEIVHVVPDRDPIVSNSAHYDDYLHRGDQELLAAMDQYAYGAFVAVVSRLEAETAGQHYYEFMPHYTKFEHSVQVLLEAPRTPFLHGITTPTRTKDAATNAMVHQILLRPTRCPGPGRCHDCVAHSRHYLSPRPLASIASQRYYGFARPRARKARRVLGAERFVAPWLAYEAEQQVLAARADAKLADGRRVAVLPDVTTERTWWLPNADRHTVVQDWLLPWLRGAGRRLYHGPWLGGGAAHCRKVRASVATARPRNERAPFVGFLAPLPDHAAYTVLRFVGHVASDDNELVLIGNNEAALELAKAHACEAGRRDPFPRHTSLGVHDEQLFPSEFLAHLRVEVSANLDLMAEARGRPRPGAMHPDAILDEEKDVGRGAERVEVEDEEPLAPAPDAFGEERPPRAARSETVSYKPRWRAPDQDVFDLIHRTKELKTLDGRAGDHFKRLQDFTKAYGGLYQALAEAHPVTPSTVLSCPSALDVMGSNAALKRQRELREQRGSIFDECGAIQPDDLKMPGSLLPDGSENPGPARVAPPGALPESPAEYARELVAKHLPAPTGGGGFRVPEDQYWAVLLAVDPLQRLWEWASAEGRRQDFGRRETLIRLMRDASIEFVTRMFLHGPGGSGKTYVVTKVVLRVYERFCPGCTRASAAQNSAARLIGGATFHYMARLQRNQALTGARPSRQTIIKLRMLWDHLIAKVMDEASLVDPQLLATLNANACWGRLETYGLRPGDFVEDPFAKVLLQLLLGDFMQLNPVMSHNLLEAFLKGTELRVPRVPTYEHIKDAAQRKQKERLDEDGYRIFDRLAGLVVLFRGSHRFLPGDLLPELLAIMRTPGGRPVPRELRERVEARCVYDPVYDPRMDVAYRFMDDRGHQIGETGFFAQGFHSAINWDQVARLQHLWAAQCARIQGQLLYYCQAVDVLHHSTNLNQDAVYQQALGVANMSRTGGLMSYFACFPGMRMKLVKRIMPPEMVQEAGCECLSIAFHEEEAFGFGRPRGAAPMAPPADHPCWKRGWVVLDRLPRYIEIKLDDSDEDYTGLGKPGVWHLEPESDSWTLKYEVRHITRCPNARLGFRKHTIPIELRRSQIPGAPERVGTFQNLQGRTCRKDRRTPVGHTIDLRKPDYFDPDEYKQHLYMILGRAVGLDYSLFRNFPTTSTGELDWHWFEEGPPAYLVHFLAELERRAEATAPFVEAARRRLAVFPPWSCLPVPRKAHPDDAEFVYDRAAWDAAAAVPADDLAHRASSGGRRHFPTGEPDVDEDAPRVQRRRLDGEQPLPTTFSQATAQAAADRPAAGVAIQRPQTGEPDVGEDAPRVKRLRLRGKQPQPMTSPPVSVQAVADRPAADVAMAELRTQAVNESEAPNAELAADVAAPLNVIAPGPADEVPAPPDEAQAEPPLPPMEESPVDLAAPLDVIAPGPADEVPALPDEAQAEPLLPPLEESLVNSSLLQQPVVDLAEVLGCGGEAGVAVDHARACLQNVGNTCFLNATLHAVARVRRVRHWCARHRDVCAARDEAAGWCVLCDFAHDVARLGDGEAALPFVPRMALTREAWAGQALQAGPQHDASEALTLLLDACEGVDYRAVLGFGVPDPGPMSAARHTTPFWKAFGAVMLSTTRCAGCNYTQPKYEMCAVHNLPVPPVATSLIRLVQGSWGDEDLRDVCGRCGQAGRRTRSWQVAKWPRALVLSLKRWKVVSQVPFVQRKLPTPVSFTPELDNVVQGAPAYRLRSVVVHHGVAGGGHYVAYVRTPGDQWYHCDDEVAPRRVQVEEVQRAMAYLLIYEA